MTDSTFNRDPSFAGFAGEELRRKFLPSGVPSFDEREYTEDIRLASDEQLRDMVGETLGNLVDAERSLDLLAEEMGRR